MALITLAILVASISPAQEFGTQAPSQGILESGASLLAHPGIQKELGLSLATSKKINDTFAAISRNFNPREVMGKTAKAQKQCVAMLTMAQKARFKEILIQQADSRVLVAPEIKKDLGLTNEQSRRLNAIISDGTKRFRASTSGMKPSTDLGERARRSAELHKKLQELDSEMLREGLKVLKPEQLAMWKKMQGKPFKLELPGMPAVSKGS